MQTLWSRIAQTTASCHCPSCAATVSGITRRTTTAASRRPSRYFTSSTLLYSGIFAAAATHDAAAKQKRRQQWDDAIADVKQELETQPQPTRYTSTPGHAADLLSDLEDDRIPDVKMLKDPIKQNPEQEPEAIFEASHRARMSDTGGLYPAANTGRDINRYNLAPQSIYAHAEQRRKNDHAVWDPKKLHLSELAVDRLILRLFVHMRHHLKMKQNTFTSPGAVRNTFQSSSQQWHELLLETEVKLRRARKLPPGDDYNGREQHPSIFTNYTQNVNGNHYYTCMELNRKLQETFDQFYFGIIDLTKVLSNICHDLSESTAPPNLNCYNTLLRNFGAKAMDHRLVALVTRAMRDSHIRMNEVSLSAILESARLSGNEKRFLKYLEFIQGKHRGLDLARADINITAASEGRLFKFNDPVTGREKIVQKPHPTPMVFESIIKGVLHFAGFEAAMAACRAMGLDGWGLSMRGMTALLMDCVVRHDWESGNEVWSAIKRVQSRSVRRGFPEKISSMTYATMVHLCQISEQHEKLGTLMKEIQDTNLSQDHMFMDVSVIESRASDERQRLATLAAGNRAPEIVHSVPDMPVLMTNSKARVRLPHSFLDRVEPLQQSTAPGLRVKGARNEKSESQRQSSGGRRNRLHKNLIVKVTGKEGVEVRDDGGGFEVRKIAGGEEVEVKKGVTRENVEENKIRSVATTNTRPIMPRMEERVFVEEPAGTGFTIKKTGAGPAFRNERTIILDGQKHISALREDG